VAAATGGAGLTRDGARRVKLRLARRGLRAGLAIGFGQFRETAEKAQRRTFGDVGEEAGVDR
jgi:hypothetical protein